VRHLVLSTAFLITAGALLAQGDRGTITGTVTDPSGRVIPNVDLVATNAGTGIQSTTVTGDAGAYTMPLLMIGSYTLEARASGFKTFERR